MLMCRILGHDDVTGHVLVGFRIFILSCESWENTMSRSFSDVFPALLLHMFLLSGRELSALTNDISFVFMFAVFVQWQWQTTDVDPEPRSAAGLPECSANGQPYRDP